MRYGKLTSEELQSAVIDKLNTNNEEVLLSAAVSEDAAALAFSGLLLLTTDPITQAGENAGALAIKVTSNDIACSGGDPFCALLTVLAPPTATVEDVSRAVASADGEARAMGIQIVGGHTEFTSAVTRVVLSVTMLGKAQKVYSTKDIQSGDDIVVTKTVGIEGTSILVADHSDKLKCLTADEIAEAKRYAGDISIIKEAQIAREYGVHAMHDITEGGIYGAIAEISDACGFGAEVDVALIPVSALTRKVCETLNVNPFRLISSGSLLIYCKNGQKVADKLTACGIRATVIGKVTSGEGAYALESGREIPLSVCADEIYKF